jgi:hypothetical protein
MKSIMDFIRIIEAEQKTFTVADTVRRLAELHQQYPRVLTKFAAAQNDRITKAKAKAKDKDKDKEKDKEINWSKILTSFGR